MSEATALSPKEGSTENLSCQVFQKGQLVHRQYPVAEISEVLEESETLVWLDVVNPGPHDLASLQEEFDLHPLSIEDAIQAHERPKIEAYGNYWFLVIYGTTIATDQVVLHEIAIFASHKFVVTVRHDPPFPLEEIERRWHTHPEKLRRGGGGFLLYTILDTVVDGYFPVADVFEEHVDQLEEALFQNRPLRQDLLPQIFSMKKEAQRFRHAVIPMRDILNPIIRGDLATFADEDIAYYRDVYDHAVRIIDQLDTMRDLVNSALEIHLSVVANRQNEVAKQLTLVATIFLPLSFIVGFFGQNFGFLVGHIIGADAFWLLGIGVEAFAVLLTVFYFKHKGWF